jgi:type IV pilus assembly protein PilA
MRFKSALRGGRLALAAVVLLIAFFGMRLNSQGSIGSNEQSAIHLMMKIDQAELMYETTYPEKGFACSLTALVGDPSSGQQASDVAQVFSKEQAKELASGVASGYRFRIGNCMAANVHGVQRILGYQVIAQPVSPGITGKRSFCSDQTDEIKFDPTGGTHCTEVFR